ncbi:hypothetical protein HPB49_005671 [Dermacentor silvarum]|uniref:Uncharacterized protein n=1 Tax=Dermacentor silvarum TaxID=543639 RepID=A0ACB8C7K3_DERSI|nr:hypothetical protein HPB49_005671 [Dermacentor silvarum]
MLRNLADEERARLLDCLNVVWTSGQLSESWLTAIVSSPQPVTAGVSQGFVLSPFLFNVALARLRSTIPKCRRFPVHCSVYADDIALWTSGPRRNLAAVRTCLQEDPGRLCEPPCFHGALGTPRQDQDPPGTPPLGHPTERCASHHSVNCATHSNSTAYELSVKWA